MSGQRLIEVDLTEQLGTNRSRLREAFRRLEAEGLVTLDRNRGASVRRISRAEMIDTMTVMRALSVLMVELAIARKDDPGVGVRLAEAMEQTKQFRLTLGQVVHPRVLMDHNAWFWDLFDNIAGNPVLSDTRQRLETTLFRLVLENLGSGRKERWIAHHEEILDAVEHGDRRRAKAAVTRAVGSVLEAILELPDEAFSW